MDAAVAEIGHNNPPKPTPFELSRETIDSLFMEAGNWLDGSEIASEAEAASVGRLLDLTRKARAEADDRRAAEVKPFDEAKAEIQARYNGLIGKTKSVTGRALLIEEACKAAVARWLVKKDAEQRAKAAEERRRADEAARQAEEAMRAAQANSIADRAQAETLFQDARRAEADAVRAEKARATVSGGARAISLRTAYRAEVSDSREFMTFVWKAHRAEVETFLAGFAQRLVDGKQRGLPGVTIHEERSAA